MGDYYSEASFLPMIRPADVRDIDALVALEQRCFAGDRLSRRSFRRFVTGGRAIVLVALVDDRLAGYALVLRRTDADYGRLYSLAVDPAFRGQGISRKLLVAAENAAMALGIHAMRLEIRQDNRAGMALYEAAGYTIIEKLPGYYEDHADGLRMTKVLAFSRDTK